MVSTKTQILALLSDGAFCSGTDLGRRLGISRSAVHKHISGLSAKGLPIRRVPGRGYQLTGGIQLLDRGRIQTLVGAAETRVVVEVVEEISSTNSYLIREPPLPGQARVCVTEHQHAGRGRRGRPWVASPYRNLMLSLAWSFATWPAAVTTLGLCAAVAAAHAVERVTPAPISLKWPNDLMWELRKLGGLLIELEGEAGGVCTAVVGLGLNVEILDADADEIDQPWIDLRTVAGAPVDRNLLAAACIEELIAMLKDFPDSGFARARAEWEARDGLVGQAVRAVTESGALVGDVRGVDEHGRLLVADSGGTLHRLVSGDVSVRTVHATG
ncbi:MAG: biotin--[acetyl-CoA-carboxylase] ligase [Gammaproteobacteria bacterium]|nr:biotin--[acetyl-CoA-carboxylase] ligase [Gammaproteobacteria bacterium]